MRKKEIEFKVVTLTFFKDKPREQQYMMFANNLLQLSKGALIDNEDLSQDLYLMAQSIYKTLLEIITSEQQSEPEVGN